MNLLAVCMCCIQVLAKMANTADGTRSLRILYTSTPSFTMIVKIVPQSDGSHDTQ